eukprot:COSAG02_NODE_25241_length_664_cov_97.271298_1_plen_74_part_10
MKVPPPSAESAIRPAQRGQEKSKVVITFWCALDACQKLVLIQYIYGIEINEVYEIVGCRVGQGNVVLQNYAPFW